MRISQVGLENFRNYKKLQVSTDSDLVLILGENAAGKTNFLESIYFLSHLKSFRAPDNLLVKYQEDYFNLSAKVESNQYETTVQIMPATKKQFKVNGQKIKKSFWQSFTTVLFVPNDLNLFHLGPLLRRKFLDEVLSQTDQSYSLDLESLEHILKQKSALLEQVSQGQADPSQLELWNQELAPVALRITMKRQGLVDFVNQRLAGKINRLTGFAGEFKLQYKRIGADSESDFLADLNSHQQAEIRSGQNLIGPHRDDFELQKDGQTNLFNSSRGELRSQILGLKLLQADYLGQSGKKSIILLDDVFSELDETRRTKLLENLSGHQIFITSTEEHHLPKIAKDALILKVEGNQIK